MEGSEMKTFTLHLLAAKRIVVRNKINVNVFP